MSHSRSDDSPTSSSEDEVPLKRRKMELSNVVLGSEERLKKEREYTAVYCKLLQTEATAARFAEIKAGINEIVEVEESNLTMLSGMYKKKMKQLEGVLGRPECNIHDVLGSQIVIQAEISQIKNRIVTKITDLSTKNSTTNHSKLEDTPKSPKIEDNWPGIQQKLSATEEKGRLKELDSVKVEQQSLFSPETSWESSSTGQSEASRDAETSSRASNIDRPRPQSVQGVAEQVSERDNVEGVNFLGVLPRRSPHPINNEDSTPEVVIPSPPGPQSNNNDADRRAQQPSRGLMMKFNNYKYVVSYRREGIHSGELGSIDAHYTQHSGSEFSCNKCSKTEQNKERIEDHVWVKHMGGKFKCPFCPKASLETRSGLSNHMKKKHKSSNS